MELNAMGKDSRDKGKSIRELGALLESAETDLESTQSTNKFPPTSNDVGVV